jgi:hypothetical protein
MAEASPWAPVSLLARRAEWLRRYRFTLRLSEQGTVVSVGSLPRRWKPWSGWKTAVTLWSFTWRGK